MIIRILAAIFAGCAAAIVSAPACAATADGGLLENAVAATVDPYVGVPSGTVSYSATATAIVCTPTIGTDKRASMTVVGAGGLVEFCIEIRNQSNCASAFNLRVTDRLPADLSYVALSKKYWIDGASLITDWLYVEALDQWFANQTPNWSMVAPLMAWEIDMVGVGGTGYLCYRATVR